MFKVVLSKVFDLRCNLEEIAGAGEPLLLFSKDESTAGAPSKEKGGTTTAQGTVAEGGAEGK